MADNFTATPGVGATFRTKEISSVHHPVYLQEPTTAGGCLSYRNINLAATGQSIKASPGQIYGGDFFNTDGSDIAYVKIYNDAGTPDETDTPVRTYMLPPGGGITFSKACGIEFTTGIAVRATLELADAGTTAPSSAVVINLDYK